jgi:hypothetical protein
MERKMREVVAQKKETKALKKESYKRISKIGGSKRRDPLYINGKLNVPSPVQSFRNDKILAGVDAGNKHLNRERWRQVSPTFYNNAIGASPGESQRLILFKDPQTIAPPRTVMEQLPEILKFVIPAAKKTEGCQTTPERITEVKRTIEVTFDAATKFKGAGESSFHLNTKLIASTKSSFRQSVAIPFSQPMYGG